MNVDEREIGRTINSLVKINLDSSEGFQHAAEWVDDERLTTAFHDLSVQRMRFAKELQKQVAACGTEPADHGTTLARLHRGLIDLKGLSATIGSEGILREVDRGERKIEELYEETVEELPPSTLRTLVSRQRRALLRGQAWLDELRAEVGP